MNDNIQKLRDICVKENIKDLALADPDEGVVIGDRSCEVHALYVSSEKKWHVLAYDHGRCKLLDDWFNTVNEMCIFILNYFSHRYKTNQYINEFQ